MQPHVANENTYESHRTTWSWYWPLMGGLLHLVQRGGDWARPPRPILARNKTGPMPLPWTTPLRRLAATDRHCPILVWCVRSLRKFWGHFRTSSRITWVQAGQQLCVWHCQNTWKNQFLYAIVTAFLFWTSIVQSLTDSSKLVHVERCLTKPLCMR